MSGSSLDREVAQRLSEHDVRYTRGRQTVVRALARSDGPRSAAELHQTIGSSVPLSSLYRSLAVLQNAGVVTPHFGAANLTRYELAEWLTGHHHHVICVECGAVDDIAVPQAFEAQVRRLVEDIGELVSFVPLSHALEIEGRCARCA